MENGGMGKIYQLTEWIMKLAYVNLLWILFSLAGLIVLGIAPATTALFAVCRKWIRGEAETAVFPAFWKAYKESFLLSNIAGLLILVLGIVFYVDYQFFIRPDSASKLLLFPLVTLGIIYLLTALFLFPVIVHYEAGLFQVIKIACIVALANPMTSFLILINSILFVLLITMLPAIVPFFGASLPAWITMYLANSSFDKIGKNSSKLQDKLNMNTGSK